MPPRVLTPANLTRIANQHARTISSTAESSGIINSILHGSPAAQEEGALEIMQHSKAVGRGKYIHAHEVHHVKPADVEEYKRAAADYYTALASDPQYKVKLTGSWETIIGKQDSFLHILEYDGYPGFDETTLKLRNSELTANFQSRIVPLLRHRTRELYQEFAFFPSAPPHTEGGVFELRRYTLKPGTLLEWESQWRKGVEARRRFITPVGGWFSQVGRLHQAVHAWQFPDMQTRKMTREQAWSIDGWAETVSKTVKLCDSMETSILEPLPFSPLK